MVKRKTAVLYFFFFCFGIPSARSFCFARRTKNRNDQRTESDDSATRWSSSRGSATFIWYAFRRSIKRPQSCPTIVTAPGPNRRSLYTVRGDSGYTRMVELVKYTDNGRGPVRYRNAKYVPRKTVCHNHCPVVPSPT